MAKCKWCETDRAVTKSGFCRDCDKMIREDILSKKAAWKNWQELFLHLSQTIKNRIFAMRSKESKVIYKCIRMSAFLFLNPVLAVGLILCFVALA